MNRNVTVPVGNPPAAAGPCVASLMNRRLASARSEEAGGVTLESGIAVLDCDGERLADASVNDIRVVLDVESRAFDQRASDVERGAKGARGCLGAMSQRSLGQSSASALGSIYRGTWPPRVVRQLEYRCAIEDRIRR